jgi:hypothetical protein
LNLGVGGVVELEQHRRDILYTYGYPNRTCDD